MIDQVIAQQKFVLSVIVESFADFLLAPCSSLMLLARLRQLWRGWEISKSPVHESAAFTFCERRVSHGVTVGGSSYFRRHLTVNGDRENVNLILHRNLEAPCNLVTIFGCPVVAPRSLCEYTVVGPSEGQWLSVDELRCFTSLGSCRSQSLKRVAAFLALFRVGWLIEMSCLLLVHYLILDSKDLLLGELVRSFGKRRRAVLCFAQKK